MLSVDTLTVAPGIAGTFAGMAEETAGYPLDLVKTRMQVHDGGHTAFGVLKSTVKNEGFLGLFRGLGGPVAASALVTASCFGTYGNVLAWLEANQQQHQQQQQRLVSLAIAGAAGGLAQSFVVCPVDVIKNRMQLAGLGHGHGGGSSLATARQILLSRGVTGLYTGLVPTLLRDVPGFAAFFVTYESLKKLIAGHNSNSTSSSDSNGEHSGGFLAVICAGGTAGMAYHVSTYPVDVIKTRIQTQPDLQRIYKGTWDCFRQVVKAQGVAGLFRGFAPTVIRSFPANAAGFLMYEFTLRLLPEGI